MLFFLLAYLMAGALLGLLLLRGEPSKPHQALGIIALSLLFWPVIVSYLALPLWSASLRSFN